MKSIVVSDMIAQKRGKKAPRAWVTREDVHSRRNEKETVGESKYE